MTRALRGGLLAAAWLLSASAWGKPADPEPAIEDPSESEPALIEPPQRHLALMPVVGLWQHGSDSSTVEFGVGPVWGLAVRVEPWSWLGVRAAVLRGNQPVRLSAGALASPGTDVYQPPLEILRFQASAEPTLMLGAGFSLYAGLGLGWGRSVAPEPSTENPSLVSLDRASVYLDYQASLGAIYEPIPHWLMVNLDLSAGLLARQSGSANSSIQAFTPDGHRQSLLGLPKFSQTYAAILGVGIIL